MLQFVDLNTGYSFDGLWSNEQKEGYVFWFPNEQSVRITYVMPICICTDSNEVLKLQIEDNDIYKFISHNSSDIEVAGFDFKEPVYSYTIETAPEKLSDNKYLHLIYVSGKSDITGEFICKINIENRGFIKIGADFYDEFEPTYINLSNFGVELPEFVQKAIYDSNVHEDYKDNILINRKFKELLSNYWDVIANKGSYKSLLNSLSWFEWGENLKIREIWKYNNGNKFFFDDKEMCSLLEDNYLISLSNFIKTTYASLYAIMQKDIDSYDSEENPVLEKILYKWSKEDLSLKISLLGKFFESFFMPIHASILHATIEDKVYTNTIKSIINASVNRNDLVGSFSAIKCNIENDSVFRISNVNTQVTDKTIYATTFSDNPDDKNNITFGVDEFGKIGIVTDESLSNFSKQYYAGPGSIIPIEFLINDAKYLKGIIKTIVYYKRDNVLQHEKPLEFNDVISSTGNQILIKFNFLAKLPGSYELSFMFICEDSTTLNKQVKFDVIDVDNLHLQLYKVKSKKSRNFTLKDFKDNSYNNYFFRIQAFKPTFTCKYDENGHLINILSSDPCYYYQYLPYMPENNTAFSEYDGIKLNRTVVFDVLNSNGKHHKYSESEIEYIRSIMRPSFLEFCKRNDVGDVSYLIYVSKRFYASLPMQMNDKIYNIIRNDLGFYPQFHYLEPIEGIDINNYTVNQYEAIACGVEIRNSTKDDIEKFRYGHLIKSTEWSFRNSSTLEEIKHPVSVREPFIANFENSAIPDGYYDICFRYSLIDGVERELILDSGFRKVSI